MPESLQRKGVSWKVYTDPGGGDLRQRADLLQAVPPGSKLAARGLAPTYPADFLDDVAHNRLPQVSWLLPGIGDTEHPEFSTASAGQTVAAPGSSRR